MMGVVSTRARNASAEVFNVQIERTHTYYVCEAERRDCELVHNGDGCFVRITGKADYPHEVQMARDFAQAQGGGTFDFFGGNSQGVEGTFEPAGGGRKVPVSLKDFASTGKVRNILRRINENARQVRGAGHAGDAVLYARVPMAADEFRQFAARGPLARMPAEGVFKVLMFETADGTIVTIDAAGVH